EEANETTAWQDRPSERRWPLWYTSSLMSEIPSRPGAASRIDSHVPSPAGRSGRVGMISLGCPKNLVDSEIMLGELSRQGYEVVRDLESAETVIVNTCP